MGLVRMRLGSQQPMISQPRATPLRRACGTPVVSASPCAERNMSDYSSFWYLTGQYATGRARPRLYCIRTLGYTRTMALRYNCNSY